MSTIDCHVAHGWNAVEDVLEHLPRAWREYVGRPGSLPGGRGLRPLVPGTPFAALTADGRRGAGATVTDPETLRRDWLDPQGIDVALLTHGPARHLAALVNPRLSVALVRAANAWTQERWLDADPTGRMRGVILVPEQVPTAAAEEIRRVGADARMAAVLLAGTGVGKPYGHPIYEPIHEAAAEMGLPLLIWTGGDATQDASTMPTAGGPPSTHAELVALGGQALMSHFASLVAMGTFEAHPDLRVVLAGGGMLWLSAVLWRLDVNHLSLRAEVPWMRRRPSELLAEQVRIVATPAGEARGGPAVTALCEAFGELRDVLCFGSAFPDADASGCRELTDALPAGWESAVREGNARSALRL